MTITEVNTLIRYMCDADSSSYQDAILLINVNNALEQMIAEIIAADGDWQYDDTNYTDLPEGTGTLVEGQQDYSFSSEYLEILNIKIKDSAGEWQTLKPLDQRELNTPVEEYFDATGMPEYYDKLGDTIRLYPAPTAGDVTLASGLKVAFRRTADLFTAAQVTTGTKVPGIPSPWHKTLCRIAAIPYLEKYHVDRVGYQEAKIQQEMDGLIKHFNSRERDNKTIIRVSERPFQ